MKGKADQPSIKYLIVKGEQRTVEAVRELIQRGILYLGTERYLRIYPGGHLYEERVQFFEDDTFRTSFQPIGRLGEINGPDTKDLLRRAQRNGLILYDEGFKFMEKVYTPGKEEGYEFDQL